MCSPPADGAQLARVRRFAALLSRVSVTRTGAHRAIKVSAAFRRNQSSISAIATNFNRPRRTHFNSGPMCLSKKSRLQPSACALSRRQRQAQLAGNVI